MGKKKRLIIHENREPSTKSHAIALVMYNQTAKERESSTGSSVTGMTELSHDLVFHGGVLGAFTVTVPEL